MRVFLGLGSNLGDRRAALRHAISALGGVVAVSPVYETEPLGGPSGQGPYLNLVVELDTFRYHGSQSNFESDRARDAKLKLLGFDVIRVTDRQLAETRRQVFGTLRTLLSQ